MADHNQVNVTYILVSIFITGLGAALLSDQFHVASSMGSGARLYSLLFFNHQNLGPAIRFRNIQVSTAHTHRQTDRHILSLSHTHTYTHTHCVSVGTDGQNLQNRNHRGTGCKKAHKCLFYYPRYKKKTKLKKIK